MHDDLDLAERKCVTVSFEAISSLCSFYLERDDVGFSPPLELGRDIRRQLGQDGFEIWRELMLEYEPCLREEELLSGDRRTAITPEQYNANLLEQWRGYGQGAAHWTEMLLVDAMANARAAGWKIPDDMLLDDGAPARAATEAVLDDLARRSGAMRAVVEAQRKAVDKARDATVFARVDRYHALDNTAYGDWLDAGRPDGRALKFTRWKARDAAEDEQLARYEARRAATFLMPGTPMPSNIHLLHSATSAVSLMARGESLPADSEDSLALSFASLHADDLRYVEEWGRWMHWGGQTWTADKTSSAYNSIREHLRKFAGGLAYQDARKVAAAKTVAAVERMARTDRRIVTTGDIWDADPWLLNTPCGIVDLRTGELRPAAPGDHMTKITACAPGGDCPTWQAFLDKSLAGDADLIAFIQRVLGYALTGDTREHALFFMYGQGGNGKGVLLNTVAGIMGDYQKTAPVDTFIDSPHERHPTDLAGLRGARLVTASETEKGRRWAEAKIKMLTGGDRIAARFMRQDFFEFVPQFKLVIAGNHKPSLRSVDAAMRRRMHMIPFTVNIPESERDISLPERLKAEWGCILAWLIEGCLAWQRGGLQPPAAVRAATDEYLSSEDVLGSWLDDRCDLAAGAWASRNDLFGSWTRWAEGSREFVGTQKQFLDAMRQHGFEEGKREGNRGFRGVRLRPPPSPKTPLPPLPM
jgi:putative DNA primase/helicase